MIAARDLSKRFGSKRVFDGLDIGLEEGGFLLVTGPNGSGKTTLLRVLAGLDAPTSGELLLPPRGQVGYLGHEPLVYRELTARENLGLFARLYRVEQPRERIELLLSRFGLLAVRDARVASYSRGMRQRLGLCRAILHQPELLILDEPFNALDSDGAALLDETLVDYVRGAVVLATHDPDRVATLATVRLGLA